MSEYLIQAELTDAELIAEVVRLAADERRATVRLVAALAEVDARRLHLAQGCSSLFVYCTRVLRLSEHAAYGRIEAARAVRRLPALLTWLERGDLTLTTVCLLAPHLSASNVETVLEQARGRSTREVEEIVAALRPRPCPVATLRKLPDRVAPGAPTRSLQEGARSAQTGPDDPPRRRDARVDSPARRTLVQPIAPARYKLQVAIDARTEEKLRRVRDLMRHANPSGDLAVVLDRALDLLVADLERARLAAAGRPRPASQPTGRSRHIPAAVRRDVWRRDDGRCAFTGPAGRCGETGFLEFHHVQPYVDDGPATAENIQLRCRAHNQYEAALLFAPEPVSTATPGAGRPDGPACAVTPAGAGADAVLGPDRARCRRGAPVSATPRQVIGPPC